MRFDPPLSEVEYRSGLNCAFGYAESTLDNPKSLVLGNHIFGLKTGVGHISFQTIPLLILPDLLLVYADGNIVFNLKEFAVTAPVYLVESSETREAPLV